MVVSCRAVSWLCWVEFVADGPVSGAMLADSDLDITGGSTARSTDHLYP